MEDIEKKSSLGYGKPPWIFKGSALYQLHLVKAETARAFIPKEFKLVEAFGYTLGGFFLANYEDSPAGIFDELVVIAGIVWNPPTSCAWAAKVLVNSDKACIHGRKDIGLPSEFAHFTKNVISMPRIQKRNRFGGFLSKIGSGGHEKNRMNVRVGEMSDDRTTPIDLCSISLKTSAMATPQIDSNWMGATTKMSLPSFSGRTEYNPHLLKYSCELECRLRVVSPAQVFGPSQRNEDEETSTSERRVSNVGTVEAADDKDYKRDLCLSVLLSKPILALEFNRLNMKVEAPTKLEFNSHS